MLATIAPRCLDTVGAVMLLHCQQAIPLSGGLAHHLTATWKHLIPSSVSRGRLELGKSCNRGGDILPETDPEYQKTWFSSNTATGNPFGRKYERPPTKKAVGFSRSILICPWITEYRLKGERRLVGAVRFSGSGGLGVRYFCSEKQNVSVFSFAGLVHSGALMVLGLLMW